MRKDEKTEGRGWARANACRAKERKRKESARRKRRTNGEERRKECTRPEKDEDDEGGRETRGGWGEGEGERRFLLRPASKMALAAAPLVIKINN